ncbi:MAG: hypothetical protein LBQ59_01155 [Candidatus Peribacteria bacterium]|nr:hypothetical protein [Candidatus Peribacteria bacterium]
MKIEEENSQIEPKILNFDSMSDGELYRNFNTIIKFVKAKEYSNIASSLNLLENFLFYSSRKSRFTREYEERKKLMISICKSLYLSENGAC